MRSAIYYPRTQVHSRQIMQSSLLLWDKLHTIVPYHTYKPSYGTRRDMAEAWEVIGSTIEPSTTQRQRAHLAIEATLGTGRLPSSLYYVGQVDHPKDTYEVWPQKLSDMTWDLMRQHGLTDLPSANGDYPFTQEGGLLVMAKLADACAGKSFARVTDRLMAYGMIGDGEARQSAETEVVPITLDIIDTSSISLNNLVRFRKREQSQRRGSDYTRLRHSYADAVQAQISALSAAEDEFERDELNRQFKADMASDLNDLRRELGGSKLELVSRPIIIAAAVTGGAMITGHVHDLTALTLGLTAALGSEMKDVAKSIGDFVGNGLSFSRKQRETMARHPMAYMYSLASVR